VKETLKLPWDVDAIREYVRMTPKDQQNEVDEKCIARSLDQNETTSANCEKRDIESRITRRAMPKRAPPGITIDAMVRSIMNVRLRWILQSNEITFEVA
jgi:hypothetical protein